MFSRAREVFADYVAAPERHWDEGPGGRGEVKKITRCLTAIEARDGTSRAAIAQAVLASAERRSSGHPPTVYIGGRGGSGSHWLAEMLHDLGAFANLGEVALPKEMRNEIKHWSPAERAMIVDAIHLLHALPGRPDAATLSFVNSRGSVHYLTFKRWDPTCLFVHLIRDPREQCMSVAFRKPMARQLHQTEGDSESDDEFLRLMIYLNRASTLRTIASPVPPDYVARYEELREDPRPALRAIAALARVELAPEAVDRVAFDHRAENIQAGLAPSKGNLYQGARRDWKQTSTARQRQFLHAGLADVIDLTGYSPDDCLGTPAEPVPRTEPLTFSLPPGVLLGELHARTADSDHWQRLGAAAGQIVIPADTAVRLRCPGGWTSSLRQLDQLPTDLLMGLCLAGNRDVRDEDLSALAGHHSLRELDLSRTAITDAALEHILALPELSGLAVLECALSPSALADFGRRRPGCRLITGRLWSEDWRPKGWLDDRFIP